MAYVPAGRVVGFGVLARLVDCFAHRLVIQEVLARQVADALVEHLGASGAACVLDAEQMCLTVRGERRREARAHAQAFAGSMARSAAWQRRVLAMRRRGAAAAARGGRGGDRAAGRTQPPSSPAVEGESGPRWPGSSPAAARGSRSSPGPPPRSTRWCAAGGAALAVAGDVPREADVARLRAAHERVLGPCDVLVHAAGILERGRVEVLDPAAWRRVLEVNLTGAFLLARAVLPGMRSRRRGRIVGHRVHLRARGDGRGVGLQRLEVGAHRLREEPGRGAPGLGRPGDDDLARRAWTPRCWRRRLSRPPWVAEEVARVVGWCAAEAPDAMNGSDVEVFG